MASLNKVLLIGRAGKDPEIRKTSTGSSVCAINIATRRSWNDKKSNSKMDETEWHQIVFYEKLADIATRYLKKGDSVYIEGRLKTNKWTDKNGVERYTTQIIADELKVLSTKTQEPQVPKLLAQVDHPEDIDF